MAVGRHKLLLLKTNMQKSALMVRVQRAEFLQCEHIWETSTGSILRVTGTTEHPPLCPIVVANPPQVTALLISSRAVSPFFESHVHRINKYMLFCVWFCE